MSADPGIYSADGDRTSSICNHSNGVSTKDLPKDAKPWASKYFDPIVRHPSPRCVVPIVENSFEHHPPA
ncbi:hypothetical protein H6F88_18100 [Oculatella sp. FACHB-28]|uniref:hypothetical protein n=1 Tax=Cyanophyceae TaxID=3028117 RepID=UPI0016895949|nr:MULTISPECIES: hypothetical protein [Cyanophyceae]MBD1997209.1 hypothetical protein [Leptolyngbya sp. FACHB-541]MBD2057908.1 hypothetical protein [Oculatella sp. FACHB-28]